MSGASVGVITTDRYYNSQCNNCVWSEEQKVDSGALAHAMEMGHEVEITFITVTLAAGQSAEENQPEQVRFFNGPDYLKANAEGSRDAKDNGDN